MTRNIRDNVELVIVSILSALVYLYVVHPILEDINPVLTFNSNGVGLGILSMAITITILSVAYSIMKPVIIFLLYAPLPFIDYIRDYGLVPFLSNVGLTFLIIIPNKYLPEKYYPENINDLQELEDRYDKNR